jgi:4-oxalocrotonate tautomerase
MPIVSITMLKGRTPEQKSRLLKDVTEAIHRAIDTPKDNVRIVLNEVEPENIAIAGVPVSERMP